MLTIVIMKRNFIIFLQSCFIINDKKRIFA